MQQVAQTQHNKPQVRRGFVTSSPTTHQQDQKIIPAVRGEYYGYSAVFTQERPLYALMKCKSNKAWSVSAISRPGNEANAFFLLGDTDQKIISVKVASVNSLLSGEVFDDIWFAPTDLTAKQFMKLHSNRKEKGLVNACREVSSEYKTSVTLRKGLVVAMMTKGGKYGMFLVSKITPFSVNIEACHILL